MDVIKKDFYHWFCMQEKRNGPASACGNKAMNTLVSVHCTEVWLSHEMFGRHVLNIFCPHSLWDIRRSKILPNSHLFLA